LQELLERQRQDFNHATVGRIVPVLLEKPGRHPGQVAGKSPYLQAVQIEGDVSAIGSVVRVRITRAGSNSLFGEAVEPAVVAAA
jgi:tRNA-2-methylthio-N6-dimethylallyladenosine synthase